MPAAGLDRFLPADGAFYLYADVSRFTADSHDFAQRMLAEAHVAAASRFDDGLPCQTLYNVGRGKGVSVRQIMDAMARNTKIDFEPALEPRRAGDPARIIGSSARIEQDFGWKATRDLDDMVSSAWAAWQHQVAEHGGPPKN